MNIKTFFKRVKYYSNKPRKFQIRFMLRYNRFFSDRLYLSILYKLKMGRKLNLKAPRRYSEKLQWLKLYDRKSFYTTMVDKIEAKKYVASIIGDDYIVPLLGVWNHFDEIDFDNLPEKFVLKTNNSGGSNGVVICKDKSRFDKNGAKIRLELALKDDIYQFLREWPYKGMKPKIFAEALLEENGQHGLIDYKVFCCNGEPRMVKVNYDVATDYHVNWYDLNWNRIKGTTIYDPTDYNVEIERPVVLEELLEVARKLSEGTSFLRVDFYCINGKLWFGELTFFPGSGFEPFEPDSFDIQIGDWIQLPSVSK